LAPLRPLGEPTVGGSHGAKRLLLFVDFIYAHNRTVTNLAQKGGLIVLTFGAHGRSHVRLIKGIHFKDDVMYPVASACQQSWTIWRCVTILSLSKTNIYLLCKMFLGELIGYSSSLIGCGSSHSYSKKKKQTNCFNG
jgi:hypothetical protein